MPTRVSACKASCFCEGENQRRQVRQNGVLPSVPISTVFQHRQAVHQIELLEDVARPGAALADIAGETPRALHGIAQQLDVAFRRFIAGDKTA